MPHIYTGSKTAGSFLFAAIPMAESKHSESQITHNMQRGQKPSGLWAFPVLTNHTLPSIRHKNARRQGGTASNSWPGGIYQQISF